MNIDWANVVIIGSRLSLFAFYGVFAYIIANAYRKPFVITAAVALALLAFSTSPGFETNVNVAAIVLYFWTAFAFISKPSRAIWLAILLLITSIGLQWYWQENFLMLKGLIAF